MDEILERLVQIGTVTAVDAEGRKARVKFQDTGITSDWLCVLQRGTSVTVEAAGQHTHEVKLSVKTDEGSQDEAENGKGETERETTGTASGTTSEEPAHEHEISITCWVPNINDTVLVLYLPVFNSDGYILGGI